MTGSRSKPLRTETSAGTNGAGGVPIAKSAPAQAGQGPIVRGSPQDLLKARGLIRSGPYFVLPSEVEALDKSENIRPVIHQMVQLHDKYVQILSLEDNLAAAELNHDLLRLQLRRGQCRIAQRCRTGPGPIRRIRISTRCSDKSAKVSGSSATPGGKPLKSVGPSKPQPGSRRNSSRTSPPDSRNSARPPATSCRCSRRPEKSTENWSTIPRHRRARRDPSFDQSGGGPEPGEKPPERD